jgi:hypothetical protein
MTLDTLKMTAQMVDTIARLMQALTKCLMSLWRRKVPGGAAGLQNQSGGRKAPGGFDSLPSPPFRDPGAPTRAQVPAESHAGHCSWR